MDPTSSNTTNPDYVILKLHITQFERFKKLVEKDEKNRERARQAIRNKRNSTTSSRDSYVKPLVYQVVN